jgi:hypothetical protein
VARDDAVQLAGNVLRQPKRLRADLRLALAIGLDAAVDLDGQRRQERQQHEGVKPRLQRHEVLQPGCRRGASCRAQARTGEA